MYIILIYSADTGKDLIIRTTIKPPTTVGPILKVPIGSNAQVIKKLK